MSEITKLYKNAGIKCLHPSGFCKHIGATCEVCERHKYPPFTAEKQIELIKLIANSKGYPDYEYFGNLFDDYIQLLKFGEALAEHINQLWQDLTEEEKQQVKGILE